ncbi:MAG TPA: MFS transporter [Candidatus Rubrimentiphilum sp.]|nr:MFS transporter [Candidatus Rubrimentiphilum sp.]
MSLTRGAFKFVILIGIISFFADFVYEGARSVTGPFLGLLGAGAFVVSTVAGSGELLGYGLRLLSGPLSERTGKFWAITIAGYVVQMVSVPLLAIAGSWQVAAVLILLERVGKATRNPPRDAMLASASKEIGFGWGFGLHEALDQFGALVGPLVIAAVLAVRHSYSQAFAVLAVPAIITLALVITARALYPRPQDLEAKRSDVQGKGLPAIFWIYLAGAALVAAGFADYSLIAYHFARHGVAAMSIPIFYATAMAVSGGGSLLFGKLFDRFGMIVLVPLTVLAAAFAPLAFLGNFWLMLAGAAVWGLGMGVHESIIPAAVAHMVPASRRPSSYGIFTGIYGIAWFAGSAVIGVLYTRSLTGVVVFCVVTQIIAALIFTWIAMRMRVPRGPY